jgi:hypothetical protein
LLDLPEARGFAHRLHRGRDGGVVPLGREDAGHPLPGEVDLRFRLEPEEFRLRLD